MFRGMRALLAWLCLASQVATLFGADPGSKIVLVYAVTRHGTRNLLPKTVDALTDAPPRAAFGEVTLLPQGQRECYNAGRAFFQRYLNSSTCRPADAALPNTCLSPPVNPAAPDDELYGPINSPSGAATWNNYNVLVMSSALDRTLLSARSFTAGIFTNLNAPTDSHFLPDGSQPIPIYTSAGRDRDDVLIRAYNKCPAFTSTLQQWYSSAEFEEMSAATATFRGHVSRLAGYSQAALNDLDAGDQDAFSLDNWYNVWDQFNTRNKTQGVYGNPMPNAGAMDVFRDDSVSLIPGTAGNTIPGTSLLGQITWLAHWLETSKSSSALVGPLFGGPILSDLSDRMFTATSAFKLPQASSTAAFSPYAPTSTYERLVIMSGHYNVQLGILAALKMDEHILQNPSAAPSTPWVTVPGLSLTGVIPSAAAVLAFELHQSANGGSYAVRAVLQNGPGKAGAPNAYSVVQLPCASAAGQAVAGPGACTLADFQALIDEPVRAAGNPSSWCAACQATDPLPCRVYSGAHRSRGGTGAAAFVVLLAAVLVHAAGRWW